MSLDAGDRLVAIEKRLGRIEQLINVVLQKQEKQFADAERRLTLETERVRYSVLELRDDLQAQWADETQRLSEDERIDQ